MNHTENIIDVGKPVYFTINGRTYETTQRWQPAADLLRLAGLDPRCHDLGELRRHRPIPVRYGLGDIVGIRRGARFVSLDDRADVI
jgi:hypothetical protein